MPSTRTTPRIATANLDKSYRRADIEFSGVDHSGSSYEGRVYVNNPEATEETELTSETGYVGSYHIFGHGGCLGDSGHCDVVPRDPYDPRPGHPLTRARKTVIGSEALHEALNRGDEITITVVPVILSVGPKSGDDDDIVKIESVRIITYR